MNTFTRDNPAVVLEQVFVIVHRHIATQHPDFVSEITVEEQA